MAGVTPLTLKLMIIFTIYTVVDNIALLPMMYIFMHLNLAVNKIKGVYQQNN